MFRSIKRLFNNPAAEVEADDIDDVQDISEAAASVAMAYPQLLDAILAVVNNDLPAIVSGSVDIDKERQLLAQRIGSPLQTLEQAMAERLSQKTQADRRKLEDEISKMRSNAREIEGRRDEQKASLMSEQRQRRALQDRNRDLEAQIAELNSEIDQHRLTISALTNKLRVAEVDHPADDTPPADLQRQLEASRAETEQLRQELEQLKAQTPPAETKRRRGRPRKQVAGNDEEPQADTSDWLLPGSTQVGTPLNIAHDPSFGYQPPKALPDPDPDMQLTLF